MQLMKAMKKLKIWSKKNKKKKRSNYFHNPNLYYQPHYYPLPQPPPSPSQPAEGVCPCHFYQTVEPSAPPLPPWLDEGASGPNWLDPFPAPRQSGRDQCISASQEIVIKTTSQLQRCPESSSPSYQQYLEPNPVSELPVATPRTEKTVSGGLFGCGVGVGSFLIRCFFPCFHISEGRSM